jgi:hypothetical protein
VSRCGEAGALSPLARGEARHGAQGAKLDCDGYGVGVVERLALSCRNFSTRSRSAIARAYSSSSRLGSFLLMANLLEVVA